MGLMGKCLETNVNVVKNRMPTCRSSSRLGVRRDDPRVPEAPEIQPEPVVEVLARQAIICKRMMFNFPISLFLKLDKIYLAVNSS